MMDIDPKLLVAGTAAAAGVLKPVSDVVLKLLDLVDKVTGVAIDPAHRWAMDKVEAKGIVAKAKAEAEAALIRDGVADPLARRAAVQMVADLVRRRQNFETIIVETVKELPPSGSSDPVDPDWFAGFVDFSKDVSEPELVRYWAKLLAAEVVTPGTVSRRTLRDLQVLSPEDARSFAMACGLALTGALNSIFVPIEDPGVTPFDLSFDRWLELDAAGLLHVKGNSGVLVNQRLSVGWYTGRRLTLFTGGGAKNVSCIPFTQTGAQLARVVVPIAPAADYEHRLRSMLMRKYNIPTGMDDGVGEPHPTPL